VTRLLRRARQRAGAIRRRLFEPPAKVAWRRAARLAETTPRFTPGTIRLLDFDLQYPDLLSLCPQWLEIFVRGTLDFQTASRSPRILDCGANVGLASLYFKRRYPRARVTAYEADPALFAVLEANLDTNGASDVDAVHAAVWTATGHLTFRCEGSDSGMIESLPGIVDGRSMTVPSVRLRDVLEREPIDLLKLDIEGAEHAVLTDCEGVLHQVNALVLDLHEFDPAARQAPRVLECLSRAGFLYAVEDLVALPWRPPVAGPSTPFPGKALNWAMTVRAWREPR
jgi:FkbM family methyltransferase